MPSESGLSIAPPFGYTELVTLQRTDRVLMPHGATPEFCRSVNALALSVSEFVAAGRDYPIVFVAAQDGNYTPVAVLGLSDRQNLFVNDRGEWIADTYVPAFVRRYPFCIARIRDDKGAERTESLVCVEKAYVDAQGIALYDESGQATPTWQNVERLLQQYEADLELTRQMCAMLDKLSLFSPFRFQVTQDGAASFTLEGMHRIDEAKLVELKPASHKALVTKGLMGRIYAHIHSLEDFGRLYGRAVSRAAEDAQRRRDSNQR